MRGRRACGSPIAWRHPLAFPVASSRSLFPDDSYAPRGRRGRSAAADQGAWCGGGPMRYALMDGGLLRPTSTWPAWRSRSIAGGLEGQSCWGIRAPLGDAGPGPHTP